MYNYLMETIQKIIIKLTIMEYNLNNQLEKEEMEIQFFKLIIEFQKMKSNNNFPILKNMELFLNNQLVKVYNLQLFLMRSHKLNKEEPIDKINLEI